MKVGDVVRVVARGVRPERALPGDIGVIEHMDSRHEQITSEPFVYVRLFRTGKRLAFSLMSSLEVLSDEGR